MKKIIRLTRRPAILTLAIVLLTGLVLTAPAGERNQPPRNRENSPQLQRDTGMNSAPRPVVDETPINPNQYGNQKKGTPNRDQSRDHNKRRNAR